MKKKFGQEFPPPRCNHNIFLHILFFELSKIFLRKNLNFLVAGPPLADMSAKICVFINAFPLRGEILDVFYSVEESEESGAQPAGNRRLLVGIGELLMYSFSVSL